MSPLLPTFTDDDEPIYEDGDMWKPLHYVRPRFDDNDEMFFVEEDEDGNSGD
jgi:hypothetical protein